MITARASAASKYRQRSLRNFRQFVMRLPQDLAHERPRSILLRILEDILGGPLFDDLPRIHEQDTARAGTREPHLVREDNQGHALARERRPNLENLSGGLGVQGGRRVVKPNPPPMPSDDPGQ